jgi:hypothetical protein
MVDNFPPVLLYAPFAVHYAVRYLKIIKIKRTATASAYAVLSVKYGNAFLPLVAALSFGAGFTLVH